MGFQEIGQAQKILLLLQKQSLGSWVARPKNKLGKLPKRVFFKFFLKF
jgi:hypothetical protein